MEFRSGTPGSRDCITGSVGVSMLESVYYHASCIPFLSFLRGWQKVICTICVTIGNKAHIRRQHHDMKGDLRRVNLTHTLPGVTAASDTVCCSKGVMTATSMAACWPQHQLGKRMSAWRALQLGTTPGASFLCPRAAVWAARDKWGEGPGGCPKILSTKGHVRWLDPTKAAGEWALHRLNRGC